MALNDDFLTGLKEPLVPIVFKGAGGEPGHVCLEARDDFRGFGGSGGCNAGVHCVCEVFAGAVDPVAGGFVSKRLDFIEVAHMLEGDCAGIEAGLFDFGGYDGCVDFAVFLGNPFGA